MSVRTPAPPAGFVLAQLAINIVICGTISAAMAWILFHDSPHPALWGIGNLAFDFIPGTVIPAFMTGLMVTSVTRKAIAAGRIQPAPCPVAGRLPPQPALRGLIAAAVSVAVISPIGLALLVAVWGPGLTIGQIVLFKLAYGIALAIVITPPITVAALAR